VVGVAFEKSRPEAMDALLRLTDAISDKGGNWQIAVKTYLEILDAGKGVEKDAALAGLGRIGDGTCVRPILTAIENADPRTWVGGIDALNRMRGRDVTRRIVEAYPGLPAKTQLVLLAVLGEKAGPEVLPILQQAARSSDSARRLAALEAIGSAGRPEGLETLTAAASEGNAEEKAVARKSILCIGDALRERGKKERAGMAYLAVLECDGDKELRARALEGIAACPTPRAFDAVLAAADEPDLKEPAMPALMTVAARLAASGEREKALAAYEKLRQSGASVETVRTLVKQMRALGAEVDLAAVLGVVTHWWLVGPFELGKQNEGWQTDFVGEPGVKLDASYQSEKGRLTWKHVTTTDDAGRIDLRATVADRDRCIAYAYSEITVEKEMEAVLRLGVDDSERIWLNGEKVFELFVARPFEVDQDQIPVKLQAGSNAILLKIWQNNMPWEFCLRITTPDGLPVMFAEKTD